MAAFHCTPKTFLLPAAAMSDPDAAVRERGFRQIEAICTDPVLIERREAEQNKFKREKM